MFKQLRQMRETTAALPAVMAEAKALQMAAGRYQAGFPLPTPAAPVPGDPWLTPIAGIDLGTYARIAKMAGDTARPAAEIAAQLGHSADAWQQAAAGWPMRMKGDMPLAVHYGQLYASVA